MTPQERELLTKFLVDLNNTPAGLKDAEAAAMIDQAISSRPDAAYVLVQHAIMADEALHRAQAELAQLRAQSQGQPQGAQTGFLGAVPPAGGDPWTQAPRQAPPQPQYAQPQYAQPQYAQPQYAQPQYAQASGMPGGLFGGGGGLGSFLRNAGTTAAGVVAGDMLFSSLGGLFGGHHGFGGGFGGGGFGGNETVIVNNYNDDGGSDDSSDDGSWDDNN